MFPTEQLWCAPEVPEHLQTWQRSNHASSRETRVAYRPRYFRTGWWGITAAATRRCHGGSPYSVKNDIEASFLGGQNRSFRIHSDLASNFAVAAKAGFIAGITAPNAGRAQVGASATCRPRKATAAAGRRDEPRSSWRTRRRRKPTPPRLPQPRRSDLVAR